MHYGGCTSGTPWTVPVCHLFSFWNTTPSRVKPSSMFLPDLLLSSHWQWYNQCSCLKTPSCHFLLDWVGRPPILLDRSFRYKVGSRVSTCSSQSGSVPVPSTPLLPPIGSTPFLPPIGSNSFVLRRSLYRPDKRLFVCSKGF